MLVRFVKQGPAYGYGLHIGEEIDLPQKKAVELIELGAVVAVPQKEEIETAAMELPEEGREVKRKKIVR